MEGYPFGPPPSAVLVATKRTARYHQLDAVVGAAVSGAYGEVPLAKPAHQTEVGDDSAIEQRMSILQLQESVWLVSGCVLHSMTCVMLPAALQNAKCTAQSRSPPQIS